MVRRETSPPWSQRRGTGRTGTKHRLCQGSDSSGRLELKRIGKLWSVRVGDRYRALGTDVPTAAAEPLSARAANHDVPAVGKLGRGRRGVRRRVVLVCLLAAGAALVFLVFSTPQGAVRVCLAAHGQVLDALTVSVEKGSVVNFGGQQYSVRYRTADPTDRTPLLFLRQEADLSGTQRGSPGRDRSLDDPGRTIWDQSVCPRSPTPSNTRLQRTCRARRTVRGILPAPLSR